MRLIRFKRTRVKKWRPRHMRGAWDRLQRLWHYRIIVPVYRSLHQPDIMSRGVLVGVFIAMLPFVGIQMMMVMGFWALQKLFFKTWKFNVIVALAWTWTTNVVTAPPLYYLYILTGNLMLGRGVFKQGFGEFKNELVGYFLNDQGLWSAIVDVTGAIFNRWGEPLLLGSLPWTIVTTWIAYWWCKKLLNHFMH